MEETLKRYARLHPDEDVYIKDYTEHNVFYENYRDNFSTNGSRMPESFRKSLDFVQPEYVQVILVDYILFYKRNKWGGYDLHRDFDKPAMINWRGSATWYKNGKVHRDHGYAYVNYVSKSWDFCKNGKWHREGNKPSTYHPKFGFHYHENHLLHRTNGPALEISNRFFLRGEEYSEEEFWEKVNEYY